MSFALAITGPTASGKTALSLALAERFGCEIISIDSMQIYERMDIGTAKATREERARVPHHMIDFLPPTESYSAEDYRADAMRVLEDIESRGKLPLFVGGTGLYMDTVMRGSELASPPSSEELKAKLMASAVTDDEREALWQRLYEVDPASAEKTHKNNVRRVVRALEIYELTGKTKTYFDELSRASAPDVRVGMITLDFHNRDNLYSRVDTRVDQMMREGLLDEVSALYSEGLLIDGTTAAQAIGYKEIITYLDGKCTLSEAVEQLKLSTRRYAKRQLTWFRHNEDAKRLYIDREDGTLKELPELLSELYGMADELLKSTEN
ncbi:MAG: tRNA (adenosine(37)-N6)-dimethylallyltransferase MiaA [Clostridia bacterium]|nr:tRNA (adenosine(37)-N6)-dimethylallyltransferase MiaA [Clostridia bacterium]